MAEACGGQTDRRAQMDQEPSRRDELTKSQTDGLGCTGARDQTPAHRLCLDHGNAFGPPHTIQTGRTSPGRREPQIVSFCAAIWRSRDRLGRLGLTERHRGAVRRRQDGALCYANGDANCAALPSSASISSKRLYFATRSLRLTEPVLICPPPIATVKSARNVSSVSPERCEVT
jgi:hypothetical protein